MQVVTHVNGWVPLIYMSYMGQNFRLFRLSNLCVLNSSLYMLMLMWPGVAYTISSQAKRLTRHPVRLLWSNTNTKWTHLAGTETCHHHIHCACGVCFGEALQLQALAFAPIRYYFFLLCVLCVDKINWTELNCGQIQSNSLRLCATRWAHQTHWKKQTRQPTRCYRKNRLIT